MNDTAILVIIVIIFLMYSFWPFFERFSTSGLGISDRYCDKLGTIYQKGDNMERICGYKRRNIIDYSTGNYYTEGGILV